MLLLNVAIHNNGDDTVKIVAYGRDSDDYEQDLARIIINKAEAAELIAWGFPPCSVYDIKLWGFPYSFTTLADGFLVISMGLDLITLDAEETQTLKVSLYSILTSGTFATDCKA